ncbi:MAG: FG-GAP repeat protein [Deltaproteobacteria bacterium]|nr:FG-GAP repeat protein [Deltaproteobacteria bacterium]
MADGPAIDVAGDILAPPDTLVLPDTFASPDTLAPLDMGVDSSCGTLTRCGGVCTDTGTDPSNCGGCGVVCNTTNGRAACASGRCTIACGTGFGDCDGMVANGCETDLGTATGHCGRCGNACGAGMVCSAGACGTTCRAPTTLCGVACADTAIDPGHCGRCGNVCPTAAGATSTCAAGTCGFLCRPGTGDCDGSSTNGCETDLNTTVSHCGACRSACAAGEGCSAGRCSVLCGPPRMRCGGGCVDTTSDMAHCGGCDRPCAAPMNGRATCSGGRCDITCNAGFMMVGGACVPATGSAAVPRQVAPLSTATVTSRQPTLRWVLPPGVDGAHVDLCRDRALTMGCIAIDATGPSAAPMADLAPGLWYWRLQGRSGGVRGTASSPVWQFNVGARSAGVLGRMVDTSWATYPDVNGDGYADVLVGAPGPFSPPEVMGIGIVQVYHGAPGGPSSTSTATLRGAAGGRFGYSVASAGDVNGDGYADVIVGAPGSSAFPSAAYLFVGGPTGLPTAPSITLMGTAGAGYAEDVASAGDINGDGYADVVVGEVGTMSTHSNAYIYFGGPSGPGASPSQTIAGAGVSPQVDVAGAGDVNGDGYADVLIGVRGGAALHLGGPMGLAATRTTLRPVDGLTLARVSGAGDVNGDGLADFLVGDPNARLGGNSHGAVQVYHGRAIGTWGSAETTVFGDYASGFGTALAGLGDVNGDGYEDILGAGPGRLRVHHGSPFGIRVISDRTIDERGWAASYTGDVNRDGFADAATGGFNGQAFLHVSLGAAGLSASPSVTFTGSVTDYFGYSVASLNRFHWRFPVVVPAPGSERLPWLGS